MTDTDGEIARLRAVIATGARNIGGGLVFLDPTLNDLNATAHARLTAAKDRLWHALAESHD